MDNLLTEKEMLTIGVSFSETLQVSLKVTLKAQHNKTLTKAREAISNGNFKTVSEVIEYLDGVN